MEYKGKDGISRSEEEIEKLIDEGHEEPSKLFGKFEGKMVKRKQQEKVKKVNVDMTSSMIDELDAVANNLNISRQAVIKTYVKKCLDEYFVAATSRYHKQL